MGAPFGRCHSRCLGSRSGGGRVAQGRFRGRFRRHLRFGSRVLSRLPAFLRWIEPPGCGGHSLLPVHRQPRSAESLAAGFLRIAPVRYDARRRSSRFRPVRARRASPCGHRRPRLPEQGVVAQRGHRRGYHPRRRHSGIGPACRRGAFCGGRAAHRAYARSREGSHRPRGAAACWIRLLGARPHSQAVGQRRACAAHCLFRLHSRARCA